MSCNDVRDQLPDYVADRLESDTRLLIDRHLGACLSCRSFRDDLDAFYRESFLLPESEPTPRLELSTPSTWSTRAAAAAVFLGLFVWAVVAFERGPRAVDRSAGFSSAPSISPSADVPWNPIVVEALPAPTWDGGAYTTDVSSARELAALCHQPLIEIEVASTSGGLDRVDALFAPPEVDELFGYFIIAVHQPDAASGVGSRVRFGFDDYSSGWRSGEPSLDRIFSLIEEWKQAHPEEYFGAVGLVTRPQLESALARIRQGDRNLAEGRAGAAWTAYDAARLGLPEGHELEKKLRERLATIDAALERDLVRLEAIARRGESVDASALEERVAGHPHFEERAARLKP